MAEYETELMVGLCQFLHDQGLGHFDPDETLVNATPSATPPIRMAAPHPAGLRGISVFLYDSSSLELVQVGRQSVQVAFRMGEDPREGTEFLGKLKRALDGRRYLDLGNVRVSRVMFQTFADLGLTSDTPAMRDYTANFRITGLIYVRP